MKKTPGTARTTSRDSDDQRRRFIVDLCLPKDEASSAKNAWLDMAYHKGYLTRKKFRELKKRYARIHSLMRDQNEN